MKNSSHFSARLFSFLLLCALFASCSNGEHERTNAILQANTLTDEASFVVDDDASAPIDGPGNDGAIDCNDGNACTEDLPDPDIGCRYVAVDDGTACAGDDCTGQC